MGCVARGYLDDDDSIDSEWRDTLWREFNHCNVYIACRKLQSLI